MTLDAAPTEAELAAAAAAGLTVPAYRALGLAERRRHHTHDPAQRAVSEATEQRRILELLWADGWSTWRIGQQDARGTQDPGVPDVYALHPRHGALWIEAKRPHGGVQSAAQRAFESACEAAGVRYVVGALPQVEDYLAQLDHPHLPRTA